MIALEINTYRYELGDEAVANMHFEDSSRCLELFESVKVSNPSLFRLIDEEGAIRGNDENLLRKGRQGGQTVAGHPKQDLESQILIFKYSIHFIFTLHIAY